MDLHILVVITCVFLASLFSLLFINKFFRRKTFEEIIAEKKAMTEKIYGQSKSSKKPRKVQQLKKELKREKKQKQKDTQKDNEADDSDVYSENPSEKDSVSGVKKQKTSATTSSLGEPESVTDSDNCPVQTRVTVMDAVNQPQQHPKSQTSTKLNNKSNKKRAVTEGNKSSSQAIKHGILLNKNEPVLVSKEPPTVEEQHLNHFEVKHPKDSLELKKLEKQQQQQSKKSTKKNVLAANATPITNSVVPIVVAASAVAHTTAINVIETHNAVEVLNVAKELKQLDEKATRQGSPKNQNNKTAKQNQKKKNEKEVIPLDKLSDNDIIGVNLLMNLIKRAELNRSEIQYLIDYLLNKQQDMPAIHSEWSDDIVQKLKRQLAEKEKALKEEQEASVGIQAKLRDLRLEINSERAQLNANTKAYIEEIQNKKQEIVAINQEMQTLNEKFALERQQFQTKLRLEKQAGSQELLVQLQRETERSNILQNDLAIKDKCINELTCIVNASHQAGEEAKQKSNEIIQSQANQIRTLEQKLDEAEILINEQRYALEQSKNTENELDAGKVEVRNLQNALDSTKSELVIALNEVDLTKIGISQARSEVQGKQIQIDEITNRNKQLSKQLTEINSKCEERMAEQGEMQNSLLQLRTLMAENDHRIAEYEESIYQFDKKEKEFLQQLTEQKEKNNELRTKNWKLVDALQKAETAKTKQVSNTVELQQQILLSSSRSSAVDTTKDHTQVRDLLERLYPDAVQEIVSSSLSISFDQWIEQVIATHIKQSTSKSSSNKSTTTNNSSSNHITSQHNHINLNNIEDINSNSSGSDSINSNSTEQDETQKLRTQNAQLRANIDELTKLVTKTGNTLSELEASAREQDEHWRSIVRSKEEEIYTLKHSNGEQQDI